LTEPKTDNELTIDNSILGRHARGGTKLRAFTESQDELIAKIHRRGRSIREISDCSPSAELGLASPEILWFAF
jgi:hypothetical protein